MIRSTFNLVPDKLIFNRDAFEDFLRDYLLINGRTDADFARAIGISPGALADIKNLTSEGRTRRQPSKALVLKIQAELNVSIGALYCNPELQRAKAS